MSGASVSLAGRHVVVTGASRGIGAACALELAVRGASLVLVARDMSRLDAVAAEARAAGAPETTCVSADLTHERDAARIVPPGMPVYGLVHCAGASESALFKDTDAATWRRMIDVNLMTAVFATRAVLPRMLAAGDGRIVLVASSAGLQGYKYVSAYAATKHAVVGLMRSLALETARDGVAVNAVCPGYVDTDMLTASIQKAATRTGKSHEELRAIYAASNPQGRLLQPVEVARVAARLCEPGQAPVTGQAIDVDGEKGL